MIIHQVSQVSRCLFPDEIIKDTQDQWFWRQLNAGLSLSLPTNTLSTFSQSHHPRRSQMANENQKNRCEIHMRKVDRTRAGWSRARPFTSLVIFKMRELDYSHVRHSSSPSTNTGRLSWAEKAQWGGERALGLISDVYGRMHDTDCHSE